jgi:putative FmdB family regulatory protein
MQYVFRCNQCKIDWTKEYRMKDVPRTLECPDCGAAMKQRITGGLGVVFKDEGFPGNDMKAGYKGGPTIGRKPSHRELDYIEQTYPGAADAPAHPNEYDIDKVKK